MGDHKTKRREWQRFSALTPGGNVQFFNTLRKDLFRHVSCHTYTAAIVSTLADVGSSVSAAVWVTPGGAEEGVYITSKGSFGRVRGASKAAPPPHTHTHSDIGRTTTVRFMSHQVVECEVQS
jgi:hypothetical protein